jgi:hypothetical protein
MEGSHSFFCNRPEFGCRVPFNILHGWKTCHLEAPFSKHGTVESHSGRVMSGMFFWVRGAAQQAMVPKPLSLPLQRRFP